jgi:hypothetical protein
VREEKRIKNEICLLKEEKIYLQKEVITYKKKSWKELG